MARSRKIRNEYAADKQRDNNETQLWSNLKRVNSRNWDHVDYSSLPKFLHDNEFLISGHRPELNSVTECLKSMFMLHTETGNFWTHAIGALLSIALNFYYLAFVAQDWQQSLVFAVYFMGATLCMGVSATYHLFICHSEPVCKFLAKMDYCGIIVLTVTSYIPWLRFAFYNELSIQLMYMLSIAVFGAMGIAVVIRDEFREPHFRYMRFGLFLGLGLAAFVPAFHCVFFTDFLHVFGFPTWLLLTGIIYLVGGLAYATRFPESVWPGKFDLMCQSHQIMHTCVIGGVLACYQGAAKLASERLSYL